MLLEQTETDAAELAEIAGRLPVDVRFIELMPIGFGTTMKRVSTDDILTVLRERWPDLAETDEKRGNGPAQILLGVQQSEAYEHRYAEALPVLLGYDGSSRAHTF